MRKVLKISAIVFLALIVLLFTLPFLFKGALVKRVNEAANSSLKAHFEVQDFSLSLFRSFPDFSLGLNGITLRGLDAFAKDTLIRVPDLYVTVDLFSVFRGSGYEVKSITLRKPRILLKALKDGRVNWNIMKPSTDTTNRNAPASQFKLMLKSVKIEDGNLIYADEGLNMKMQLSGVNNQLSGDLTADRTTLSTKTLIEALTVDYGGVRYFNKTKASLASDLEADMKNMKFTFKTGDILLNSLPLKVTGWFAMPKVGYDMDLKFSAPGSDFKNFLSLIPALYARNFESLKTSGALAISGFVKGHYDDHGMPAFGADIRIDRGMFQYPQLPAAVNNVSLKMAISNPSGVPDATVIDLQQLHFQILSNAMDLKMMVTHPVSDPQLKGAAKGKLNLADLHKVYPMEQTAQLSGTFDMDVQMDGKLSSVQKGQYQDFKAAGFMVVQNLKYGGNAVPKPVDVSNARLDFTPAALNLSRADLKIGSSDLSANGKIGNYLGYFFNKGKLTGNVSLTSNYLNIDELMPATAKAAPTQPAFMGAIIIPNNIDVTLATDIKKLKYSKMDISNVNGKVTVANSKAQLNNLKMNMLNGDLTMNGSYDTQDANKPVVDFDLNINSFDIRQAATAFTTLSTFAPIAQKAAGLFSSKLKFKSELKANMTPDLASLNCAGSMLTNQLRIDNVNTLNQLATTLKLDRLKNLVVDKLNFYFEMVNGKLFVKPFDFTALDMKANLSGSTALNQSIDWVLALDIPRKEFGGAANSVLNNLVSQVNKKGTNFSLGETVKVNVLIGGTLLHPTLKTGLKEAMGNVAENIKLKAQEELLKKKDAVASKALSDANAKAQAILDQARKQCDDIMAQAKALSDKTRTEAGAQIDKLTAEADQKGPLASFAAKKVADRLRKEADNKSAQILTEAQKRCDQLIAGANQQADDVKKGAGAKVGL